MKVLIDRAHLLRIFLEKRSRMESRRCTEPGSPCGGHLLVIPASSGQHAVWLVPKKGNRHDVEFLPSYPEQRLNPISVCNLTPPDFDQTTSHCHDVRVFCPTTSVGPSGSRQCALALAKKVTGTMLRFLPSYPEHLRPYFPASTPHKGVSAKTRSHWDDVWVLPNDIPGFSVPGNTRMALVKEGNRHDVEVFAQ